MAMAVAGLSRRSSRPAASGREEVARLARAAEQRIGSLGDHGHRLERAARRTTAGRPPSARGAQPALADDAPLIGTGPGRGTQRRRFGAGERLDLERERKAPGALRRLQALAPSAACSPSCAMVMRSSLRPCSEHGCATAPAVDRACAGQAQLERQREQVERALGRITTRRGRGATPAPGRRRPGLTSGDGLDLEPRGLRCRARAAHLRCRAFPSRLETALQDPSTSAATAAGVDAARRPSRACRAAGRSRIDRCGRRQTMGSPRRMAHLGQPLRGRRRPRTSQRDRRRTARRHRAGRSLRCVTGLQIGRCARRSDACGRGAGSQRHRRGA